MVHIFVGNIFKFLIIQPSVLRISYNILADQMHMLIIEIFP